MVEAINNSDSAFQTAEDALKQNTQLCFDAVNGLIVALDKNGIVVSINQKGADMLGYPKEEIVGKNWFEHFISREEEQEIRRVFDDMIEGRSALVEYHENFVLTKSGAKRSISFHNILIKGADGVPIGTISSGEDLTNEKKLGSSLARQENFNEVVSDNLPIGFCINTISNGKVVFMNKKFEEIYGWPRDILTDVDAFFEHVYPDPEFRKKLKEQVMMDIMSGNSARMIWKNLPIMKQSGETAYITAQNIPLYEYDLMVSTVMDVTRQVKLEQSLRESEHLQRALLNSIVDVVWMKDDKGIYLAVNEAFLARVGKRRDEVIGKTDFDFWPKEYAEKYRADDEEIMKNHLQKRIKETVPDLKGNIISVETVKTPVYDDAGTLLGVTGIARIIEEPSAQQISQ